MDDCMNLTYVCCFNNKTILEEMLMHSFGKPPIQRKVW